MYCTKSPLKNLLNRHQHSDCMWINPFSSLLPVHTAYRLLSPPPPKKKHN